MNKLNRDADKKAEKQVKAKNPQVTTFACKPGGMWKAFFERVVEPGKFAAISEQADIHCRQAFGDSDLAEMSSRCNLSKEDCRLQLRDSVCIAAQTYHEELSASSIYPVIPVEVYDLDEWTYPLSEKERKRLDSLPAALDVLISLKNIKEQYGEIWLNGRKRELRKTGQDRQCEKDDSPNSDGGWKLINWDKQFNDLWSRIEAKLPDPDDLRELKDKWVMPGEKMIGKGKQGKQQNRAAILMASKAEQELSTLGNIKVSESENSLYFRFVQAVSRVHKAVYLNETPIDPYSLTRYIVKKNKKKQNKKTDKQTVKIVN